MSAQTFENPIDQHHYDVISERIGLRRLEVEAAERAGVEPPPVEPPAEQPLEAEQPAESLRDLAIEQAALKLLSERVAAATKDVKKRTQAALDLAAKRDGVERIVAELPNGQAVATVGLRKGETGPVVVDEDAFARWVRQTFPDEQWTETRIVRTVKPWKAAEFLAEMDAAGAPRIVVEAEQVDAVTAEVIADAVVHDVPGVLIKPTRARTHAITWRKEGREAVAEAWRNGRLTGQMSALMAPPEKGDAA
ncbi:hypothetical protein OOK39_21940 [Streptomyces sp. NBC_00264]|uniref:hypothetical protein n=1 Tax=unclassified Streptomyces TaxID=2593676 RepID=UPI0022514C1C|nr:MULTISPECIES: hypothetical protein [unclassified Streptomyces]MCX5161907.1 hypothetical protein [Streptomyces sp. NBC_00305]MCX5220424.1 hypothetical protein [Streptomyces sp. NBC_00264]